MHWEAMVDAVVFYFVYINPLSLKSKMFSSLVAVKIQ